MIERQVTFNVLHGKERDFERFFREAYRPAMMQTEGFVSASLLREQEVPNRFQMRLRFDSLETAASWRASKAHEALKPDLKSHYEGSELQVYDVLVD
jgi:heme-degrading monooxygenase HmoA